MPDQNPSVYSLVPWVRRGLGSLVTGTPSTYYATLPVSLVVNGGAVTAPRVRLLGPGDITSIDARAVIRTDPRDGAGTFEPNYLAMVEFVQPDFPWLFTPSAPSGNRMKPWICLVVVPATDGVSLEVRPGGISVLRLTSPLDPRAELPNLDQIDFWAHAQVTGDGLTSKTLPAALDGDSTAHLSRVISPRKLDPARRYIACLVPTFRAGVNAALGLPVDEHDVAPAWDTATTAPFTLPVYYHFTVQTGPGGDFASLARKIGPPKTPLVVGTRRIDVSQPGFGAAAAPGVALDLEGALRAVDGKTQPWPAGKQAPYQAQLKKVLAPPAAADPVVTPPVYGKTQTGKDLPAAGAQPVWMGDLNLDPRTRATAGAGTQVVQRDQEALVASAWDQLGEIRKANQLLRQAQLARQVAVSIDQRHLKTVAGDGTYLQITAPVHARVLFSGVTMRGAISASRLPVRSVSPALRKMARPRGPLGRRLQTTGTPQLVDRLNMPPDQARSLVAAGPVQPPKGMVALDDISPAIQVVKMNPAILHTVPGWATSVVLTTGGGVLTTGRVSSAGLPASQPLAPADAQPGEAREGLIPIGGDTTGGVGSTGGVGTTGGGGTTGGTTGGGTTGGGVLTKPIVDWSTDPDVPDFFKSSSPNLPAAFTFPSDQATFSQVQEQFRGVAATVSTFLNTPPPQFPDRPPLAGWPTLAPARAQLGPLLDPEKTITSRMRARIPLGTRPDPLEPLSAGPNYPQAAYAALAELSSEWMLPGISQVPIDTATLLKTNPPFVEAYLVGLNQELANELLWREFPTGLHATYFHNFWGGNNGAPDIPSIDSFDPQGKLGDHTSDHSTGGRLVLLIRAELFQRYPSAVVSAVKAEWNADKKTRKLGTERQFPIFRGDIGVDVTFFGFNVDDPRGSDDPAANRPGWFFVIEEHVTEPRFGLEPDTSTAPDGSWNDLSWNDLPGDGAFLNPAAAVPKPSKESIAWGASSGAMAYILMRRPARVALHGKALLPKEGA